MPIKSLLWAAILASLITSTTFADETSCFHIYREMKRIGFTRFTAEEFNRSAPYLWSSTIYVPETNCYYEISHHNLPLSATECLTSLAKAKQRGDSWIIQAGYIAALTRWSYTHWVKFNETKDPRARKAESQIAKALLQLLKSEKDKRVYNVLRAQLSSMGDLPGCAPFSERFSLDEMSKMGFTRVSSEIHDSTPPAYRHSHFEDAEKKCWYHLFHSPPWVCATECIKNLARKPAEKTPWVVRAGYIVTMAEWLHIDRNNLNNKGNLISKKDALKIQNHLLSSLKTEKDERVLRVLKQVLTKMELLPTKAEASRSTPAANNEVLFDATKLTKRKKATATANVKTHRSWFMDFK